MVLCDILEESFSSSLQYYLRLYSNIFLKHPVFDIKYAIPQSIIDYCFNTEFLVYDPILDNLLINTPSVRAVQLLNTITGEDRVMDLIADFIDDPEPPPKYKPRPHNHMHIAV